MIETALVAVAAVALAAWTLAPVFRRKSQSAFQSDDSMNRLIESKHAAYRSILDLEFDHRLGKVSDQDYAIMRKQHEAEAVGIIREMDRRASLSEATDLLEAEIAAARNRLRST